MKSLTFSLALMMLLGSAVPALAQSTTTATTTSTTTTTSNDDGANDINKDPGIIALRAKIAELRAKRDEIKAKVKAGTLTKAQAYAEWDKLLEEIYALKRDVFEARFKLISARADTLAERKEEMKAAIAKHLEAVRARRDALKAKNIELRAKVRAGTLTRDAANAERKKLLEDMGMRVRAATDGLKAVLDKFKMEREEGTSTGTSTRKIGTSTKEREDGMRKKATSTRDD